jgi:hypothetical protein
MGWVTHRAGRGLRQLLVVGADASGHLFLWELNHDAAAEPCWRVTCCGKEKGHGASPDWLFLPSSSRVLSVDRDGQASLWDLEHRAPAATGNAGRWYRLANWPTCGPGLLACDYRDGLFVTGGATGEVVVARVSPGGDSEQIAAFAADASVHACAVVPGTGFALVLSSASALTLLDLRMLKPTRARAASIATFTFGQGPSVCGPRRRAGAPSAAEPCVWQCVGAVTAGPPRWEFQTRGAWRRSLTFAFRGTAIAW